MNRHFAVVMLQAVTMLVLIVAVVLTGYLGRVDLRDSQIRGCERGKLDRAANASGWRSAQAARLASGTNSDLVAARHYDEIAAGLEARSRIRCEDAFPQPRLLP